MNGNIITHYYNDISPVFVLQSISGQLSTLVFYIWIHVVWLYRPNLFAQFLWRQQALSLYREFLRVLKGVKGAQEREEMKAWIRGEFEQWRHTTDEVSLCEPSCQWGE